MKETSRNSFTRTLLECGNLRCTTSSVYYTSRSRGKVTNVSIRIIVSGHRMIVNQIAHSKNTGMEKSEATAQCLPHDNDEVCQICQYGDKELNHFVWRFS